MIFDFVVANQFKQKAAEIINNGEYTFLNSGNPKVFAYMINYRYSSILVVLNKDLAYSQAANIHIKTLKEKDVVVPLAFTTTPSIEKAKLKIDLLPGEIEVFMISKNAEPQKK